MEATQIDMEQEQLTLPQEGTDRPKLPKKKKRWLKWGLIALAALTLIWALFLRPKGGGGTAAQYTATPVSLQDLTEAVAGTGALAPIESYYLKPLATGEVLEAPFEVGDRVEKGQLLYRLDAKDAEMSIQQALLTVRQAQKNYDDLAAGLTPRAGGAGVVQQVHVQKGDLVSPGTPIADIADTSTMTVTLPFHAGDAAQLSPGQRAQVTLSGTLEVLPGTVESVSTADLVGAGGALVRSVKIRVDNPGALTRSHTATAVVGGIACAGSGSFEENMRQTVVAQANGEVTRVHVTAGSRVDAGSVLATLGGDAAQGSLEDMAIALENAQLSLQRAQDALEDYTITAPISGTVIEKNVKAGDNVNSAEGAALAVIYDLSALKLEMNISELDLNELQVGQQVEVAADALPGQTFTGHVDRVSINGTTTNGFTTYPVTVVLEDFGDLNPGMNVSADIVVERIEGALSIPAAAVQRGDTVLVAREGCLAEDGLTVVDPTKAEERQVTLGGGDGAFVQVLSGLEEGETVLVPLQSMAGPAGGDAAAVYMGG